MHKSRIHFHALLTIALGLSFTAQAGAHGGANLALSAIHIDNIGQINETYYRGAQPDVRDYADLAALGIKTVIDLTRDGQAREQGLVEKAGMHFFRIPLTTSERPSDSAVARFLEIVNNPLSQPVYVHCQGGRHRTGVMTAIYRMTHDGWTADQAYGEMKKYRFEGFPGHPELKAFVFDFFTHLLHEKAAGTK